MQESCGAPYVGDLPGEERPKRSKDHQGVGSGGGSNALREGEKLCLKLCEAKVMGDLSSTVYRSKETGAGSPEMEAHGCGASDASLQVMQLFNAVRQSKAQVDIEMTDVVVTEWIDSDRYSLLLKRLERFQVVRVEKSKQSLRQVRFEHLFPTSLKSAWAHELRPLPNVRTTC